LKAFRRRRASKPAGNRKGAAQRARQAEVMATLRAIRDGEVDAVMLAGKGGDQIFTLAGAEQPYRVLIESMNEGALTLAADKTILYANQCFAGMVKYPLEQVIGSSFHRFLAAEVWSAFKPVIRRSRRGTKTQVVLVAGDGSKVPAQISIRALKNGSPQANFGMVVTDLTEGRRTEERLRALTHRVVQVQEAERGRVALELHDNITQVLCALVFRSQALVVSLSGQRGPSRDEAIKLREMLGTAAKDVERISNNLTPHVLNQLGLVGVLREARTEFAARTGIAMRLTCVPIAPLPPETELALYRIVQEALRNVEKHADAKNVSLHLGQKGAYVRLSINDGGRGFDLGNTGARRKKKVGLGLHSMQERAEFVGGSFKIRSRLRLGTAIEVLVPARG
jgi:two-component system, NarL family, sensor kinase